MSFYKTFTIKDTIAPINDSIRLVSKPTKAVGFSHVFVSASWFSIQLEFNKFLTEFPHLKIFDLGGG